MAEKSNFPKKIRYALRAALKAVGRAFCAVGRAFRAWYLWMRAHKRFVVTTMVVTVLALALGLSLGLTLPVKSVEVEGEVILLQGEAYTGGFNIKQTTRAGLVHREEVKPDMLTGFDPDVTGDQTVTVQYRRYKVKATVKVLALTEVTLKVREGSLPAELEPNDAFPISGIFDLYYNNERIRSAPILLANAPEFSSRLSGNFEIYLNYQGISISYSYTVE